MRKTILITGSTDGIGLAAAKMFIAEGHNVLMHGRSRDKLEAAVAALPGDGQTESFLADLSRMDEVEMLAESVAAARTSLDVVINNAGVYEVPEARTQGGLDIRFVVNTIAPYLLTQRLLPLLGTNGRVVNLSSAAQSPVDLDALAGNVELSPGTAYAQSKLAITMWSRTLALSLGERGPAIIAVNPASMLGSRMVKEAYGVTGGDLRIGAEILVRAALAEEFAEASGRYFDNDSGRFASPHPDALDSGKSEQVVNVVEAILRERFGISL